MPTVNLGGRKIKVDDSFLSMSPADQQKTLDEIEASLSPAPAAAPAAPAFPPVQLLDSTTHVADPGESWTPDPNAPAPLPPERPVSEAPDELAGLLTNMPAGFGAVPPERALRLGAQAVGRGLSSLAAPDAPVMIGKGVQGISNQIVKGLGLPTPEQWDLRRGTNFSEPIHLPSEKLQQGASWVAQKLGYQPATSNTLEEKALSNILQIGTEAGAGAFGLSRLAAARAAELALPGARPMAFDKFIRPYAEEPIKTVIGDVAGGAGAGAGLTGSQEIPPYIREKYGVGTLADLMAMATGGVSAGTLASMVQHTPSTVTQAFLRNRPAPGISIDPVTGASVSNRVADETAALLQSRTSGAPKDVAAQIAERVQAYKDQGLPVPTTGLIPDDLGLASFEKRQRTRVGPGTTQLDPSLSPETRQQYSFAERDAAQRQAASDQVQSVQQPGVDQTLFQSRAAERAQMELEARQRAVDQPTGQAAGVQQAREVPATELGANVGQTPGASADIYDVYKNTRAIERDRSQALYSRPEFTEHVFEASPLQDAASEIRARATGAAPVTPRAEAIIQRIETAADAGTLTGRELSTLNKDIESEIKLSLRDGQDFQQLKTLKDGIAQTVTQLPRAHPAREAVDIARANTAERIAPNFREGAGGALDMRMKTSPGQVQPEEAGATFLNRGRDAEQLMRIAELRGNTQEVAQSARAIVLDRLAQAGVVKDGVIDADKLIQWRNKRANVIDQIPGLGDEINGMIRDARRGAGKASQYADEISAAEARLAQTQKDIAASPVGKIADKTPQEAVASIMGGPNAAKNMTELRARMGNNPEATQSLKAAVADHFAERVKQIDSSLTNAEHGVSLQKLVRDFNNHRETLVAAGFTPEEMQALQRAQTALMPLTKRNVQATVGSTTAESTEATLRPLELAMKYHYGTLKGGSVMRNIKIALRLVKGDTGSAVEQLATRAMFDPDLAQTLLTRDIKSAGTPAWNDQLQKAIRRMTVAQEVATPDPQPVFGAQ